MLQTIAFFMMGDPNDPGSTLTSLIFPVAIFLVFYLFIIRPQSKKQKEIRQKVDGMKKGDKVVTSSGIIGILNAIEDDTVLIEVGSNVKIRFQKTAISDVNPNKPEKKDK